MDPEVTLDQIDVNGDIAETHHNAIESLESGDTRLSFLKKAGLAGATGPNERGAQLAHPTHDARGSVFSDGFAGEKAHVHQVHALEGHGRSRIVALDARFVTCRSAGSSHSALSCPSQLFLTDF